MHRLGLDVGTNSIGWILIDTENHSFVDGGTLIFPDGRNPKDKTSNATKRREKRGPRRNRDRGLRRRRRLDNLLTDLGLLPTQSEERDAIFKLDPWYLRAKVLDRQVTPFELGRALWSFHDRRGFKSNRKTDKADDKGKMKQDINLLQKRIDQSPARTLGEFLHLRKNNRRHKSGRSIKARLGNGLYPDRSMIEQELGVIMAAQAEYHPDITEKDWQSIIDTILYQRLLKPVEIGKCTLNPNLPRAYKAMPTYQRFRILQDLANLRFARPGEPQQLLDQSQRYKMYYELLNRKDLPFDRMRLLLDLPAGTHFNLEGTSRSKLDGDLTAYSMANKNRWGKEWRNLSLAKQDEIVTKLLHEENEEALISWLQDNGIADKSTAERITTSPLPAGTASFSLSILSALVEVIQDQGLNLSDAVKEIGYDSHSQLQHDGSAVALPYYGAALPRSVLGADSTKDGNTDPVGRYGRLANPTVHIALGQIRRLFNEITDLHGKPSEVAIELARDLKRSQDDKKEIEKQNKKNQDLNLLLKEQMETAGVPFSPHNLRKMQLWHEQKNATGIAECPFTGTPLNIEMVLSDATEIEHLLPFSKSLDDLRNNKVLVMRDANREKGRRTPAEWFMQSKSVDAYQAMIARVQDCIPAKAWRFAPDAWQQFEAKGDFLSRQLNETRYLSRMVREYLTTVVHPDKITVSPGHLTALLRGKWGLNNILNDSNIKDRLDHRHHMIDAAVVGLTTRSILQKVATASHRAEDTDRLIADMPVPWEGFREELASLVRSSTVHFKPNHAKPAKGTTTGALHNDTAYGIVDGPDAKGMYTLVYRKPLDSMSGPGELDKIRNPGLKQKLKTFWESYAEGAVSEKQKWQQFCLGCSADLNIRSVRIYETLSAGSLALIRDKGGKPYKAYKTDGNAFMDIWLLPNGKTKGETVTRYNAHQKDWTSEIKRDHPTAKKLMRLHINDMVATGEGTERRILRVQQLSGQTIVMVDHNEAGNIRERSRTKDTQLQYKPLQKSAGTIMKEGLRKISVSRTGKILDRGPIKLT
ncbi:hypothetical protein GCM10017044_05040 [Kordiimonas sediminis]|uniref:CRISPR-associated endonuclease Cas9 n=1 Tax=Kordiimonas sediminis TaxID=1735581 RepID=A0A919ALS8_9PROT|nr:type II CRISPR RNA-guided endonuclease Cas9 [Kordiimonas sediminis]GHF13943.1 hypothetical protein GCM10017044_05040 [Kordiimonas sediminis]